MALKYEKVNSKTSTGMFQKTKSLCKFFAFVIQMQLTLLNVFSRNNYFFYSNTKYKKTLSAKNKTNVAES